jgi:formylglycine-generating enzyme required for sulfatase activity
MVWIQPGTFTMGSPTNEVGRFLEEGPQTQVTISRGFWMSKYATTQEEYLTVMGNNPSHFTGDLKRPVEQVRRR